MRSYFIVQIGRVLFATAAAFLSITAGAAAQAASVYTQQLGDRTSTSVEYEGEGWRNLRKLYISVRLSDAPKRIGHFYVVCGTDKILMPHQIYPVGTTYDYPGKKEDDQHIVFGESQVLVDRISFYVSAEGDEQPRMRAAIRSPCSKDPVVRIEPNVSVVEYLETARASS